MYDRIANGPGSALQLGAPEGGRLLLAPPSQTAGQMPLVDMQNRVWHLLREPGPDTNDAIPVTGDFNATVVARDLNIALAQFISETGIAPSISERMGTFPVFPLLDYPLPPDLVSLTRVEYSPQGQFPYVLIPVSFTEFDQLTGGLVPPTRGQPRYFREPFAGSIRLQPAPGPGNAAGPIGGVITLAGTPIPGGTIRVTITFGAASVTAAYTFVVGDTLATVATGLSNAINASIAVQGPGAFLAVTSASGNLIYLFPTNANIGLATTYTFAGAAAVTSPTIYGQAVYGSGTAIYGGSSTAGASGGGVVIMPYATTPFAALPGDLFTFYYTSMGNLLIYAGDTPGIPAQFHMALVYRVLVDYWQRKSDNVQSMRYEKLYDKMVQKGKSYTFDMNRASQPTIAGDDFDDASQWP